jgi:uncharacterized protein (TIGR02231 family)
LLVGAFETENELQVQVKPQLSSKAFLVSRAKLLGEAPVLPGAVNMFRDGSYVGQTSIPLLRQGEKKDLAFGIDDQVSVKRNVLKDEKGEAGLLAKDNTMERHFVTEINNLHSRDINLVVLETIPVSKNEQIKVELLPKITTPGYISDADNIKGLLRWQTKLGAKKDVDVNLGWRVTWPKDNAISGL